MPLTLGSKTDSQSGDVVQCLYVISASGVREITDRLFIGSELVGSYCVLPYGLVPMASNDNGGRLLKISHGASDELSIQLKKSGEGLWLSECFVKEDDKIALEAMPPGKKAFILDRGQLHHRCGGRAQAGTLNQYDFKFRISRALQESERVVLAQWQATPDLLRHKINGEIRENVSLHRQPVTYEKMLANGAIFDEAQLAPLSLEIREGFLVLIARYDNKEISDLDQCDIVSIATVQIGYTQSCGEQSQAVLIYKTKFSDLVDKPEQWISISIRALWGKYTGPVTLSGRISLTINDKEVQQWAGWVGRNDHIGPFMTIGAAFDGDEPLDISFSDVFVRRHIPAYDANLIKNPNNYGNFSNTWKIISRNQKSFFHNRIRWAGWNTGYFGTPHYKASRMQEIDLGAELATEHNWSVNPPEIFVLEQFNKTYCGGDSYHMKVEVYNTERELIGEWKTGVKKVEGSCSWGPSPWVTEKATVAYSGVPRYIRFFDGGVDREYWAGYYGPRIREATVILRK